MYLLALFFIICYNYHFVEFSVTRCKKSAFRIVSKLKKKYLFSESPAIDGITILIFSGKTNFTYIARNKSNTGYIEEDITGLCIITKNYAYSLYMRWMFIIENSTKELHMFNFPTVCKLGIRLVRKSIWKLIIIENIKYIHYLQVQILRRLHEKGVAHGRYRLQSILLKESGAKISDVVVTGIYRSGNRNHMYNLITN